MLIVSILERFKTFSTRELLLAAFLLSAITGVAAAETGTQLGKARFQWAGVDHPSVVGYTIHWGTQSGVYTESADLGLVTDVVLQKFQPGVEYFAAITAFSADGGRSSYSEELSFVHQGSSETVPTIAFHISRMDVASQGQVTFDVTGSSATQIRVYVSADLEHWDLLATKPFADGELEIADPGAVGATRRFYRMEAD